VLPAGLGPAGPLWAELGLAKKKIESVEIQIFTCLRKNVFLSTYSMISGS